MNALSAPALLLARVLLAFMFILSGWGKITGYAGTVGYMESVGVPGILLPGAIVVELIGGLLVLVGYQTRIAALAIAGFTVIAGYLFHYQPADQMQMIGGGEREAGRSSGGTRREPEKPAQFDPRTDGFDDDIPF